MKAVRIHAYGDANVLRYEDAPMPDIAPEDVLVRVVAASVNPVDWKFREGYLKQMLPPQFPITLGWDVSGVVDAVGKNVSRFKVGDTVFSRPISSATALMPSMWQSAKTSSRASRRRFRTSKPQPFRWRA